VSTRGLAVHVGATTLGPNYPDDPRMERYQSFPLDTVARMTRVLAGKGFTQQRTIVDEGATRSQLLDLIAWARTELAPGGHFVLTFGGHGKVSQGRNPNEPTSEGWVLYDALLWDDELHAELAQFPDGRITVVSDSCYAAGMASMETFVAWLKSFMPPPPSALRTRSHAASGAATRILIGATSETGTFGTTVESAFARLLENAVSPPDPVRDHTELEARLRDGILAGQSPTVVSSNSMAMGWSPFDVTAPVRMPSDCPTHAYLRGGFRRAIVYVIRNSLVRVSGPRIVVERMGVDAVGELMRMPVDPERTPDARGHFMPPGVYVFWSTAPFTVEADGHIAVSSGGAVDVEDPPTDPPALLQPERLIRQHSDQTWSLLGQKLRALSPPLEAQGLVVSS
jgi:hypothetical protein